MIIKTILSTGAIHKQAYGRIWPEGPGLWISNLSNYSIAQMEKLRSTEFQYICLRSHSGQIQRLGNSASRIKNTLIYFFKNLLLTKLFD